ncbi:MULTISPECIES: ATP-binding protein [Fischerella]|uniref:ATP-binding protein n=1 Tax=Fischerella TaxID=1190 RepID=UPI000375C343|nr:MULTISPECIES: ATP-binding protein [Fischerella]MBD2432392.1 ATP-binding protein [Fischerella sp. FACHB-380]
MTDINDLRRILNLLAANTCNNADFARLCQILDSKQIIFVPGERSVGVGGSISDSVIITGDNNVVYKGPNAEVVYQIVQDVLESFKVSALLTHSEFSKSAVITAKKLAGYWEVLVGRDGLLAQIQSLLAESPDVIVLHGPGGIGKTRFLLELPKIIPTGTSVRYVRIRAESIEYDLASLDCNSRHVIVVDDAHRFGLLHQLGEILINPALAGKVTLVLATRSLFKDSVIYKLGYLAGYKVNEIEVQPLENIDIDQLLRTPPYEITHDDTRHILVRIAKGDPLIAGVAARLVQRGESVINLSREQVLTSHCNDIIRDLKGEFKDEFKEQYYIGYLEILAALGTIDLNNQELREKVQKVVNISQSDEDRVISRLVEAGIVERYWKTIKITSEVLADHILLHHFFQTKQADYQKKIIEPFFELKPKEILTTLAEAEVKGEAQAGLLLDCKLDELRKILIQGDYLTRLSVLEWLQDLAYLRSDDALSLVADIVDEPDKPAEFYQGSFGGDKWEIKHDWLLSKAVEILRYTYLGSLQYSIVYLHKLARYRPLATEYANVRDKASKALVEIAEIKVNKLYDVQLTLLKNIEVWLKQDFTNNLELSISLIQSMLNMVVDNTKQDATKYMRIIIQRGCLQPSESLRQVREQALEILYQAYSQAYSLPERLKIIKSLELQILLPLSTDFREVTSETWVWLKPDCQNTVKFFLNIVIPNAELPILDAVAKWIRDALHFNRHQLDELELLSQQLKNNNLYQLYLSLFRNKLWDDSEDDYLDWKALEKRHQQAIHHYLEGFSPTTIEKAIWELELMLSQCTIAGESSTSWFETLFYKVGENYPELVPQIVEKALSENLIIKQQLGRLIGGLYRNNLEAGWSYIQSWIDGDDLVLWLAVAGSYHFLDWSVFQDKEWEVLYRLINKKSSQVDLKILELISRFAPHNPLRSIEFLKIIANRSDENVLLRVAEVLSWSFKYSQDGWGKHFITSEDLLNIVQNFERLSRLDYAAEECLAIMGKIDPMNVIDFIERRIIIQAEQHRITEYYEAIHLPYSLVAKSIQSSTEYSNVLRRVRDWMLREDVWLYKAPKVLKEIAGSLSEPLYSVLMEWVKSGDVQKLHAVAKILRVFNSGQLFYSLSREIICITNNEIILSYISTSINSTPGVIVGGFSNHPRQRQEEISSWLEDENFRVRRFANRMKQSLQEYLERELETEEFEERNW